MAINANHTVEVLNGISCSIVEKAATPERANHIVEILKASGLEVVTIEEEGKVKVGVTDVRFCPVMAVYNRYLKTKDGKVVTPALWYHNDGSFKDLYWLRGR